MSSRARFARSADSIGMLDGLLWLRAHLNIPELMVLTYHRITESGGAGELDQGAVETNADQFAEQLEVVRKHCTLVSIGDVIGFQRGRPLPRNAALIAFDDGYSDNLKTVLPVLRRLSIPATFFVPTAFPDAGTMFWWDRIALTMKRCTRPAVQLEYPRKMMVMPGADPARATEEVLRAIKTVFDIDLRRLWEDLERATGVILTKEEERCIARRTILSWSQVRELRTAGMDVQSHSHRHMILSAMKPEAAYGDLRLSREILSQVLGEEVRAVAYPVGYPLRGPWRRSAEEAGFTLGFTYATGRCRLDDFDPLNMERLAAECSSLALYKLSLVYSRISNNRAPQ